jgi:uncharacterized membrane protein YkvI
MNRGAWRIALLFSAAALGGTYLSGYEWLRFFASFGSWGAIGITLTSIALGWFCYALMSYCEAYAVTSLNDLFLRLFGPKLASSLSVLTHIILLAYAGTMVGQQALQQSGGRHALWFIAIPCLLAFWLAQQGFRVLVRGSAVVLASGLILIGVVLTEQRHVPFPSLLYQPNAYWAMYACLYVAMHVLLCTVVLLPLLNRGQGAKSIRLGLGIGSLIFFFVTMLGHAVLLAHWHEINTSAVPLREILSRLLPFGSIVHTAAALAHSSLVLACLTVGITVPVAERNELKLAPMFIVMLLTTVLFSLLPLWREGFAFLAVSATAYSGLLLLVRFCWKR